MKCNEIKNVTITYNNPL